MRTPNSSVPLQTNFASIVKLAAYARAALKGPFPRGVKVEKDSYPGVVYTHTAYHL